MTKNLWLSIGIVLAVVVFWFLNLRVPTRTEIIIVENQKILLSDQAIIKQNLKVILKLRESVDRLEQENKVSKKRQEKILHELRANKKKR